jgi:hypothetical protein
VNSYNNSPNGFNNFGTIPHAAADFILEASAKRIAF